MRYAMEQPIKVTSGFRSPTYNASVGGATFSRHMYGDALDFKSAGRTPSQLKVFCEEQGASYIQVYTGHVHCDWRNEPLPIEFYPKQNFQLDKLQKAQTRDDLQSHFFTTIKLHSYGKVKAGNTIQLFVVSEGAEESDGDLLREWKVSKGGQIIQESNQTELQIQLEPGTYSVEVTLGGYWKKMKSIVVN